MVHKGSYDKDGNLVIDYRNSQKLITREIKVNKIGQVQLKIKFSKQGRNSIIEFGYSYFHNIYSKQDYHSAKVEAFKSAYKKVPFSPDNWSIIDEKYIYFIFKEVLEK